MKPSTDPAEEAIESDDSGNAVFTLPVGGVAVYWAPELGFRIAIPRVEDDDVLPDEVTAMTEMLLRLSEPGEIARLCRAFHERKLT